LQFRWDNAEWPNDLKLFIRDFSGLDRVYYAPKYGGFVLTHNTLFLRGDKTGRSYPPLREDHFDGNNALYSEAFMEAFDDLVTTDAGHEKARRKGSDEPRSDAAIKRIILESLDKQDVGRMGVPTSIDVKMMSGEPTTRTSIEWCDDHFILHLGWQRGDQTSRASFRHIDFGKTPISLFIAKWPCGALGLK
jgi:hypothetical protein